MRIKHTAFIANKFLPLHEGIQGAVPARRLFQVGAKGAALQDVLGVVVVEDGARPSTTRRKSAAAPLRMLWRVGTYQAVRGHFNAFDLDDVKTRAPGPRA